MKNLFQKINDLKEDLNISNRIHSAVELTKDFTQKSVETSTEMVKRKIGEKAETIESLTKEYWPTIELQMKSMIKNIAREKMNDPKVMGAVFESTYELLPVPIRLLISRTTYINYCMSKKDEILLKISLGEQNKKTT